MQLIYFKYFLHFYIVFSVSCDGCSQNQSFIKALTVLPVCNILTQYTKPTKNTPYLTLIGELWDVYHEYFGENWLGYNGTLLCLDILTWNPSPKPDVPNGPLECNHTGSFCPTGYVLFSSIKYCRFVAEKHFSTGYKNSPFIHDIVIKLSYPTVGIPSMVLCIFNWNSSSRALILLK